MSTPAAADPAPSPSGVTSHPWGRTPQGEQVTLYTLTNKNGVSISIMDYGATIVKILVPDRNGKMEDVALGFDQLEPYFHENAFFGTTPGRFANRIAKGQFTLGHTTYHLPVNNAPNSLHGGLRGFDKYVWQNEAVDSESPAIRFTLLSPDGDQGYPGNLFASVTYTLNDENQLRIAYSASTDKPTVINLTNHTYFNLVGAGHGSILGHILTLHADHYLPVDKTLIPTGEIAPVAGTPYDFLSPTPIGLNIKQAGGYDNCYVLNKKLSGFLTDWAVAAEVEEPTTGRTLKVSTDQPGVQFFTPIGMDGSIIGKEGRPYRRCAGFCLETEHYPDAPNQPKFPSTVLNPGDTYETSTVFEFGVK